MALADLIDEHRAAFEYDWRTRFREPLSCIGRSTSWGEAFRLTGLLLGDTSSHVGATVAGWERPATREELALMELWDLQYLKTGAKKRIRYPRPWPSKTKRTAKPDVSLTQDEIIAALRMAGHTGPVPGRAR